jgi:hypothetical protein
VTDAIPPADEELVAPQPDSKGPRSTVTSQAGRLLGAAALLSTTALLPALEPKMPPFRAD